MTLKILHNPRCSKSRQTLQILKDQGLEPVVIDYIKTPITEKELMNILDQLKLTPRDILRKNEKIYKELGLSNKDIDDKQLRIHMVENPILIERPIVISDKGVRLGRPPESVMEII
ncbi:arsenate reductase (glutaredoxin) [Kiloniella antarctica]|uniref:Arsenate reductase n=1 Tax=Kiloniella antarctica TaxID=1550907 RepID=A0ABW5BLD8_9PROT